MKSQHNAFIRRKMAIAAVAKKKPTSVGAPKDPDFVITEEYRTRVRENSHLGKKGYTIPKEYLHPEDLKFLYKDLFVKPVVSGATYGVAAAEETAFPVYRENDKKIYLPRFYGQERYGLPSKTDVDPGLDIGLEFSKSIRDYQENIIGVYTKHVDAALCVGSLHRGGGGILEVPCGRGKCLGKNTPVLMYNGTIKMVQDIVVGDVLMGDDSTPRNVLTLARGRETMYKINDLSSPNLDISYTVNASHILSLREPGSKTTVDMSVAEYLETYEQQKWRGYRVPIHNDRVNTINLPIIQDLIKNYGNHNIVIEIPEIYNNIVYIARSCGYKVIFHSKTTISIVETDDLSYDISVSVLPEDDYYGFEIDGNRRFVLGDFTVTHNTVMGLKIISLLHKKTLILVHKEFLMNQWIERINEFLPGARIGKIQAQVMDIENKDIVIGMIQTLYDKDYPGNTFSSFGLTIIDEVHRIGSEQFSKTLTKIVTPYMLGISATVDRKDKLTKVLYMFIGNKIYTEARKDEDPVCVRGIVYNSSDPQFNEVEYDWKGTPKYSTMITKLCEFGPRSDFIVRVVRDLVEENPENQIMILAHNRSLLTYLHDAIAYRQIAEVGYYVGGMKQAALQETETKHVVLATYAMAAEALDIKTLSTLVMVTPKTDIVQSVGRILRVKHENPIIVDIVDSHDVFQNQWTQRKRFYKKCNYRIRQIDSRVYAGMSIDWNGDKTWKRVFEPVAKPDASAGSDDEECGAKQTLSEKKCLIKFADLEEIPENI
uniref:Helicase ATP-binding domain-containing protein n=1 Tax=viral metagenome TaxID=1070528 RepID=A0A6C0HI92_9ZZZZ